MNSYKNDHDQPIIEQIKQLEDLIRSSPEDFWLGLQLSQLYLANEQYTKAKSLIYKLLNQAETAENKEAIAKCKSNLGIISLAENNCEEAKKWMNSALQIYEVLEEPSMLGQTCYHLALAHWADGESQQAIELLERSADLLPNWPLVYEALAIVCGEEGMGKAYHHYARGLLFEFEQDYTNAITEFQEAIMAGFVNSEVFRRYGICLSELENYEKAVPALRKSIQINPQNALSHADLAFIYHKLGMERMAVREYEMAVELAPQLVIFYLNMVETYLQLEQLDEAQIWVEKALSIENTDPTTYWFHGRICLKQGRLLDCQIAWHKGLVLAHEGRIKDAIENDMKDLLEKIAPSTIEQRGAAIEALSKLPRRRENVELETIIASLKEVCRLDPYFIEAQMELAQVYLDAGRASDAKRVYAKIVREQPRNQDACLGLGIALMELGALKDAEDIFRKANALAPQTEKGRDARLQLAILDVRNRFGDLPAQRFEEAMNQFKKGDGNLQEIIDSLTEAVAIAPGIGLFHFELGWMYLLSERLDNAARQFRLAIESEPGEGRFYGGLGLAQIKQDKVKEAVPLLLKAIDLDPTDPESHTALGICYLELDDILLAETEFRKVTELDPYQPEGWNNLRELLLKQNMVGLVVTELRRLLHLVPDADFADEAEQFLNKIITTTDELLMQKGISVMVPEEVEYRLTKTVARLCQEGEFLRNSGFIELAKEKFQEAISEYFEAFDPHFFLANLYASQNQHQEAIKEYFFAISMKASEAEIADAYYNMGNSYRIMKDFDQAIAAYQKAITIYPDILDARANIGVCLSEQNKYEEAIRLFRDELDLNLQRSNSMVGYRHFQIGQILLVMGKDLEALFEFQKGILGGLNFGVIHFIIGTTLASRGIWNLAQAEFEKALDQEPDNGRARASVKALRFIEYELPWMLRVDDPRVQHSLTWHGKQIQKSYPTISERVEIIHHENGKYEKRRIPLD